MLLRTLLLWRLMQLWRLLYRSALHLVALRPLIRIGRPIAELLRHGHRGRDQHIAIGILRRRNRGGRRAARSGRLLAACHRTVDGGRRRTGCAGLRIVALRRNGSGGRGCCGGRRLLAGRYGGRRYFVALVIGGGSVRGSVCGSGTVWRPVQRIGGGQLNGDQRQQQQQQSVDEGVMHYYCIDGTDGMDGYEMVFVVLVRATGASLLECIRRESGSTSVVCVLANTNV